jgi:hypothetical protein
MKVGPRVQTIDDYINACPPAVRKRLVELRTTIRAAAPDAIEKISYQMPIFYQRVPHRLRTSMIAARSRTSVSASTVHRLWQATWMIIGSTCVACA